MKCYFKKILKLGILSIGLSLFLYNCQKKEEIVHQEFQQNGAFSKISFDEFKSKTNLNSDFKSFSRFFDINKPASKASFNKKSSGEFDDAIILTDNIIRIEKDDFSTYTFTILTQTENYEFYNLVLYIDNNQEIYKSHILKYTPSDKWLADTTKHFSGNVKIINNDIFNVDNLLQSKSSLSSKSILLEEECIDDVIISYECSNRVKGHREGNPGPEGGCFADEFYVYINILPIPCDGGEDNGNFDPETDDGEGGYTSGGGDDDIVTAPNTEPDAWDIKNFESGILNTEERNYYNSDPDIKGTIDNYLKLKNFSYTPKQEAKASLKLGECLKLNFEQFNWVFNNRESSDYSKLNDFLNENLNSLEAKAFAKLGIEALRDNDEVDFEEQIIIDDSFKNNQRLKCVYDKFKTGNNTISNYLENFLGEKPVAHLKFSSDLNFKTNQPVSHHGAGAVTVEPQNYVIEIIFNSDSNLSASSEYFPTIILASDLIHEMVHAEIYRKLLSLSKQENIPWSESFINSIKNDYLGLHDYYMRWKYNKPEGVPVASAQHQLMAQSYRTQIIAALKNFDSNIHDDDFYETLSWSGLVGTVAWNNLSISKREDLELNFDIIKANETFNCN